MEPPVPSAEVLKAINSVAPFAARIGASVEALVLQKNAGSSVYSFLAGGEGRDYYLWKVRALKAAKKDISGLAIGQRRAPLSVGERGLLLGEGHVAAASAKTKFQTIPESLKEIAGACLSCLYYDGMFHITWCQSM